MQEQDNIKSWNDIENQVGRGLDTQKKNALFESFSAILQRDGEISKGMIMNACKGQDDLAGEMLEAVKEHQPVYEDSANSKLVVRDE